LPCNEIWYQCHDVSIVDPVATCNLLHLDDLDLTGSATLCSSVFTVCVIAGCVADVPCTRAILAHLAPSDCHNQGKACLDAGMPCAHAMYIMCAFPVCQWDTRGVGFLAVGKVLLQTASRLGICRCPRSPGAPFGCRCLCADITSPK
jgi:hypothetical protein